MALIKCISCGRNISDKAKTCPHCGQIMVQNELSVTNSNEICENNDVSSEVSTNNNKAQINQSTCLGGKDNNPNADQQILNERVKLEKAFASLQTTVSSCTFLWFFSGIGFFISSVCAWGAFAMGHDYKFPMIISGIAVIMSWVGWLLRMKAVQEKIDVLFELYQLLPK